MPGARQRRNCPFCGTSLVLGDLTIVATNEYLIHGRTDDRTLPSGTPILGWDGREQELPVIARAPLASAGRARHVARAAKGMLDLPAVSTAGRAEDLPARLCSQCRHPLPVGIDHCEAYTIAVVGTQASGKTHFLASMLRDAYRLQGLEVVGCEEFSPEEETATRYDRDYYQPLFDDGEVLSGTQADDDVRFRPLTFRVRFVGREPCLVMFHDVAGETLTNRSERSASAGFVRRAAGVIFLVDPTAIRRFRRHGDPLQPNQATLLSGLLDDRDPRRRVPFAITLSKSDLVSAAIEHEFLFGTQPPADAGKWSRQMRIVGDEVRQVLHHEGMRDLLAAARRVDQPDTNVPPDPEDPLLSFHAVAPLGGPADGAHLDREPRPVRCLEPLATLLFRIPGIVR